MKTKRLLIETIRIQNGRVRNIKYHNQRCNQTRKALFSSIDNIDLRKVIDTSGLDAPEIKCRITYDDVVRKVEFETYTIRPIRSLKIVEIGAFDYRYKYANREGLKSFFDQRGDKDDILMTRNGFITDTYYANVALRKAGKWYTPENPLLKGSMRAQLLVKGEIEVTDIHVDEIKDYESISIFNAMIPFKNIVIRL